MADHCPLKRCATPEDVARVVAFLSSDDGGWVNGKSIQDDGAELRILTEWNRPSHYHLWWIFPVDRETLRNNGRAVIESMEGNVEIRKKLLIVC